MKFDLGQTVIVGSDNPSMESKVLNLSFDQRKNDKESSSVATASPSVELIQALAELKIQAESDKNILYQMKRCLILGATVSDICNNLREVWGEFKPI
jgi:hypothetical protein